MRSTRNAVSAFLRAGLTAGALLLVAVPVAAGQTWLYDEIRAPQPRFGLAGSAAEPAGFSPRRAQEGLGGSGAGGGTVSPFLAGLMSSVVPGTGQLVQGQRRGWFYLGVEAVSWFSFWALRSTGNQAEEDFQEFGDIHWNIDRYDSVATCGPGLGAVNFEEERAQLLDLRANSPEDYYEDIGRRDEYACGWDDQNNRSRFQGMRDDANRLFRTSRYMSSVALLNRVVSAIDAAKSAANRRAQTRQSLNWQISPAAGSLAVRIELNRTF